jgi:glucose-1-phosphate cytidylyltransferase
MKAVIFAGGLGTRLSEETSIRPKPMVEVGNRPILWHIMKIYSSHGINDFIICCGYKGYVIKEYFANYFLHMSDVTFDLRYNQMNVHLGNAEPWKVTLIDTGETTMTGGRLKRVREHIGTETFCLTYGDGVSNVNITELIKFHKEQGTLATLTAVQPPGRFGAIALHEGQTKIESFQEKPEGDGAWINGGYFVVEPDVIDFITGDDTVWEQEPLTKLAQMSQLSAFKHAGFWQPMDTLRDRNKLEDLWATGSAPWKVW